MKRAWMIFKDTYSFPEVPFNSIGRNCFAACMKKAWLEAKQVPAKLNQARIDLIKAKIEDLPNLGFGFNIAKMRNQLETELAGAA
tara:strand:- start:14373 stop:14627 length:255 start_codon:yes stop_codon:yes gene_type:complete